MSRITGISDVFSGLLQKLSAFFVRNRRRIFIGFLWWSIVAAIPLPALSQIGYQFWSLEYVLVTLASFLVGLLCYFMSTWRPASSFVIFLFSITTFLLYFGGMILGSPESLYVIIPSILAFAAFSALRPDVVLRLVGFAACAQIIVTVLATPKPAVLLIQDDLPTKDIPSVIHILFDAHASIAAFPESALSSDDVARLENTYLSKRFTVFRRAYSADKTTQRTMARLFNPTASEPPLIHNKAGHSFFMTKASMFKQVSQRRSLDVTFTSYVNLAPAVKDLENVTWLEMYRANMGGSVAEISEMPLVDRLWNSAAMVYRWFLIERRSPLIAGIFTMTDKGRSWNRLLGPASIRSPLISRKKFLELTARLDCCGKRGTYVFAHLIYPHSPFLFDQTCKVFPVRAWLSPASQDPAEQDSLAARGQRWRRHFQQALCAANDISNLLDRISQHAELADATIIIHGDHGPRIAIEDYEGRSIKGYNELTYERDLRGTFLAVRIPRQKRGRVVNMPVRIDDVYRELADHDFLTLDPGELQSRPDSPYDKIVD